MALIFKCKINSFRVFYVKSTDVLFRITLIISVVILSTWSANAFQEIELKDDFIIKNFNRSEFLPSNTVSDIHSARNGFLYTASNNGLIVSDGLNWDVIDVHTSPELRTNRILKVFETDDGQIIIQDQQNYLYKITPERKLSLISRNEEGEPVSIDAVSWDSSTIYFISNSSLNVLYQEGYSTTITFEEIGKVWDVMFQGGRTFILATNGLYELDIESGDLTGIEININTEFFAQFEQINNSLFVIGKGGADCIIDEYDSDCSRNFIALAENVEVKNVRENQIDGSLIFGTDQGMYQYKNAMLQRINALGIAIQFESYFEINSTQFLVTTNGVWANGDLIFEPSIEIVDATTDGQSLWITADQEGIFKIKKNRFTQWSGIPFTNNYALIAKGDLVLAGSFEYGVSLISDQLIQSITSYNSDLPNNTVRMIAPLNDGSSIISTWGAPPLRLFENIIQPIPELDTLDWPITNVAEGFYEFDDGTWLIGTLDNLLKVDNESVDEIRFDDGDPIRGVSRIVENPFNNELFLASQFNGLSLYRNNQIARISDNEVPSDQQVRDVFVQSKDTIWVATYNSGLHRYILDEVSREPIERTKLGENSGLPESGLHNLNIDEHNRLWISSNNGLFTAPLYEFIRSADELKPVAKLRVFSQQDGLINPEFNGGSQNTTLQVANHLWFANQAGIVRINTDDFEYEPLDPQQFYIRTISGEVTDINYPENDTVTLSHKDKFLELDFALSSTLENQTPLIWIKEGNNEWVKPEETGRFSTERIRGSTETIRFALSPEDEVIYTLTIQRKVPFYAKPWFYGVLLFGIAFIGYRLMTAYQKKKYSTAQNETIEGQEDAEEDFSTVERIIASIEENYSDPDFNLDKLSASIKMSKSKVYRDWSAEMDESLNEYLLTVRMNKAKSYLDGQLHSITEVAELSGFKTQSYFSKVFKKYFGLSPSAYVKSLPEQV